jgi:CobQ-like glutamine amidotransferase family enzyme
MSTDLHITQLYINEMNTYGDRGNLLCLSQRIRQAGYNPVIHYYHVGGELPKQVDIVLGGGGQDAAQTEIQKDIQRIRGRLEKLTEAGVPMLLICGTYQLFAHRFITNTQEEVKGIGIFDAETIGGDKRLIGNTAVSTKDFDVLYGFENHSGRTYLHGQQAALGTVTRGNGNNGEDKTEGARTNNVLGSYLHGPILPANPRLCDWLIKTAAKNAYGTYELIPADDTLANLVRQSAAKRKY